MKISDNIKSRAIGLLISYRSERLTSLSQYLKPSPEEQGGPGGPATPETDALSPIRVESEPPAVSFSASGASERSSLFGSLRIGSEMNVPGESSLSIPNESTRAGTVLPASSTDWVSKSELATSEQGDTEHALRAIANLRSTDDGDIDMSDLVTWLDTRVTVQKLGLTTSKCYRRWLASYFESISHREADVMRNWIPPGSPELALVDDESDAMQLADKLSSASQPARREFMEDVGNSRYLTFLDRDSVGELLAQLLKTSSNGGEEKAVYASGPAAALMFTVTMMTGLRPFEWPVSRYLETFYDPETKLTLGPVLEVDSLKQNGRREDNPLRDKRYLVLSDWPDSQLAQLQALMSEVEDVSEDFKAYYNRIRMTLSRAWKRVLKDRRGLTGVSADDSSTGEPEAGVSLYTARHIFAEEIRRDGGYTRYELAAMLGHSLLTNQVYYGPKSQHTAREYSFVLPKAWPGDADDIMRWDHKVNPLRNQYMQQDLFGAGPLNDETEEKDGVSSFFLR